MMTVEYNCEYYHPWRGIRKAPTGNRQMRKGGGSIATTSTLGRKPSVYNVPSSRVYVSVLNVSELHQGRRYRNNVTTREAM